MVDGKKNKKNIEVSRQVGLDFGREGNQNDRKCKEKIFKFFEA